MRLWPFGSSAQKARQQVDTAASLVVGANLTPQWPDDNYLNFAAEGYSRNEVAFACVQAIATSGSEARLRLVSGPRDEPEEVDSGPLVELLEQPNEEQSQFEFLEELLTYLYISGNNYVFKLRGGGRKVLSWHNLRPDRVQVWPGERRGERLRGYIYTLDGTEYLIAPDDVIHIKRPNPTNDWYGLSPFHVLARRVNLDTSMTAFQKVFFENAGVLSGILKLKRRLTDDQEANRIRGQWRNQFAGIRNWHRIAILDEDAEYQQMALDVDKMTMRDLTEISESRICAVFGVPLSVVGAVLGMESSSYANRESDQKMFWRGTLMPEYRRISGALTRGSRDDFSEAARGWIEPDFGAVPALQENEDAKAKRAVELFASGLAYRNEARAIVGLDPLPPEYGDVFRVPIAVTELGPGKPEPEPEPVPALAPGQSATAETVAEPDQGQEQEQPTKMLNPGIFDIKASGTGVIVALVPDVDTAAALAVPDGEPASELHITLAFLGDIGTDLTTEQVALLQQVVSSFAASAPSLSGEFSGVGRFYGADGMDVLYASVDIPGLPEWRQQLVTALEVVGLPVSRRHGFTPHMTLRYVPADDETTIALERNYQITFDRVHLWAGIQRTSYALTATAKMLTAPGHEWRTLDYTPTERESRYLQLLEASATPIRQRMQQDIEAYHQRLANRVNGVMGRQMQRTPGSFEGKALEDLGFDESDLVPPDADTDLQRLFAALQLLIIETTWNTVNLSGLVGDVPFDAGTPAVQRLLSEGATRVVQINETTRQAIRESLIRGVANGYSIQQMANGVPADGYPGIRSLVTEMYRGRAEAISVTETATAQNAAASERYKASGVAQVLIMDGVNDEPCKAVSGTRQTVEWFAANPISHPRCRRAGLPIIEAAER